MDTELGLVKLLWQIDSPRVATECVETSLIQEAAIKSWSKDVGLPLIRKVVAWEYHLWCKSGYDHSSFFQAVDCGSISAEIVAKYPALVTFYRSQIVDLKAEVSSLASRIKADRGQLARTFSTGDLGAVTSVEWGMGDPHCGGQRVHLIHFNTTKIIYKPRSVRTEIDFQHYVDWVGAQIGTKLAASIRYLDQKDYGWVEYVSHQRTDNSDELSRYYQRFGGLLAVLYTLSAVDFHYENLIACGEYPTLIDLECCLQPKRKQEVAEGGVEESVMSTAMLPSRLWNHTTGMSIDVGAVSAKGGAIALEDDQILTGLIEGPLRLVTVERLLSESKNQPDSLERNPGLWADNIDRGFTIVYEAILAQKDWLQNDVDSPLRNLEDSIVRFLPRNTYTYSKLLRSAFHPQVMQSHSNWERHWNWLKDHPAGNDLPVDFYAAEIASLSRGDIPYFTVDSRHGTLEAGRYGEGSKIWRHVFGRLPRENIRHRLNLKMSLRDLVRQRWFIKTSLCLLTNETLKHSFVLADSHTLFNHLEMLGGALLGPPYWLTISSTRVSRGDDVPSIGRLNAGTDQDAIDGIDLALSHYIDLYDEPLAKSLLNAHRQWGKSSPRADVSVRLGGDLDSSPGRVQKVNAAWVSSVARAIADPSKRDAVDCFFKRQVDFTFAVPNGVMTASFSEGISGLLFLSCLYHQSRATSS